jgi:arylsulfatase
LSRGIIVADIETTDKPANGVVVAQGGRFGGWSLHVKEGVPMFTYHKSALPNGAKNEA